MTSFSVANEDVVRELACTCYVPTPHPVVYIEVTKRVGGVKQAKGQIVNATTYLPVDPRSGVGGEPGCRWIEGLSGDTNSI